jgi:hypothetical protein
MHVFTKEEKMKVIRFNKKSKYTTKGQHCKPRSSMGETIILPIVNICKGTIKCTCQK